MEIFLSFRKKLFCENFPKFQKEGGLSYNTRFLYYKNAPPPFLCDKNKEGGGGFLIIHLEKKILSAILIPLYRDYHEPDWLGFDVI